MKDRYVTNCPYCGGTEMIETYQSAYAALTSSQGCFYSSAIYHSVCRRCGSVVRSYVKDPEKLLKKKDRKKNCNI